MQCFLLVRFRTFFEISYQVESIFIYFETRLFPKRPSELMFAQSLEKIQLGCVVYGIVTIKGRVTCITNEVKLSRHDCVFQAYFCESDSPVRLDICKAYMQYCPLHPDDNCLYQILHFSQKSRRMTAYTKCHCKLCVKDKPPSLKSLSVNKSHEKSSNYCMCIKKLCFYRKI